MSDLSDPTATPHKIEAYGQSSFDGWWCRVCRWQGQPSLSADRAQAEHDRFNGITPVVSDPTALPDDVREAAKHALDVFNARRDDEIIDALAPVLAAHFAAELDGLRAQIEETREQVERPFTEHLDIGNRIGAILAQSPRGTVAPGQADEQTALSALIHGRFEEARGRHGVDPDRVARFILDSNWLAARDRAVREAALEEAAQIAESSTNPAGFGHGSLNEGSRSRWYAHGKRDSAAAIRAAANPFASSGDTTNGDKTND